MTQEEFGKQIAALRKQAGYTQQTLAEALFITDKAVSKWERGICLPDSTLLPKIASLLDTDLGTLIPDQYNRSDWKGLLILNDGETTARTLLNGRPLIHYLLSYFLLLGITDIEIRSEDADFISNLQLSQYGFRVSNMPLQGQKTMVVYGKTLLFGAYLTKQLQTIMASEEDGIPVIDGRSVPILFSHRMISDLSASCKSAKRGTLFRGTVLLPLETHSDIADASTFIQIYEKHHRVNFCDLSEIASRRGLIPPMSRQA